MERKAPKFSDSSGNPLLSKDPKGLLGSPFKSEQFQVFCVEAHLECVFLCLFGSEESAGLNNQSCRTSDHVVRYTGSFVGAVSESLWLRPIPFALRQGGVLARQLGIQSMFR